MPKKPPYEDLAKRVQELELSESKCKKVEKDLWKSENRFRNLFNQAAIGIIFSNRTHNILDANPRALDLLGYSKEEIKQLTASDLLHPENFQSVSPDITLRSLLAGKTIDIERKYRRKDGSYIDVLVSMRPFEDPENKISHVVLFQDITERKRTDEALRESEEKYRDIFVNLMDVYFKTTLDGAIVNVSPSAEIVSGYSASELIGKKVDMLYHNPKDRKGLLAVLMEKGQAQSYELLFKKKNGDLYHASINAVLNFSKDGKPISLTGTIRDITESKKTENEKILAQKTAGNNEKLALVGQIAGKMAHDFNNVLGIIMGNTELSLLDCKDDETKKTLELIYEQTIRGKNLTKNLVAFAKDQEPKQEFFRISEKIELVLNLMKKDLEGIELRKEENPDVPELLADPGMIEHALVNLIQNSIHAISMVEYPIITIRTYSRDNHICFEIEDNGCGITKKHLATIYEPSFTLKGNKDITGSYRPGIKGTGYGMSNVKKYVEQHKGNISVESESGLRTKFTISLPIIKRELTSEEKKEIRKEIAHFQKYILLVEDEQAISDIQYRILTQEPCNHKVDIANNAQVAMDLFERNKYDLVSLDYILPGNLNGMNVYHHIRATDKTIPILFISGNIKFLESIKKLKQKDTRIDHLSKPCQNKNYVTSINGLFERRSVVQYH